MRALTVHLTAHTIGDFKGLCKPERARWLWTHLRRAFPNALAVSIIPDHVHVVTPYGDLAATKDRLGRVLQHFARRFKLGKLFGESETEKINTLEILMRTVRYVMLNPVREGLTKDPCGWPSSTHRDVLGAAADPWVTADRLAAAFGRHKTGFVAWFHRYVSSDKDVAFDGTPCPRPAKDRIGPGHDLATISRAAAAATRTQPSDICHRGAPRTLFVLLARSQGWRHTEQLAQAARIDVSTVRRISRKRAPELLNAGLLCLGDERLRRYDA